MTHESSQPSNPSQFDQVNTAFREARGADADERWARSAQARLLLDDVSPKVAETALTQLVPLLQDANEPAEDLFGSAHTWAREQQQRWRETGVQAYSRDEPLTLATFLSLAFSVALWVTVLTMFVTLIDDGWTTEVFLPMVLLPLTIGLMSISIRQIWLIALRKFSRRKAIAVTGIFLLTAGVALGGLAVASNTVVLGTGSTLWLLAPIPIYALLSRFSRLLDSRSLRRLQDQHTSPLPDDQWSRGLMEQLRLRQDISETEIRSIVSEAQAHAREAKSSLHDEFGAPESYAARFSLNASRKARTEAFGWTSGAILAGGLTWLSIATAGTIFSWNTALYGLFFVAASLYALGAWRRSVTQE